MQRAQQQSAVQQTPVVQLMSSNGSNKAQLKWRISIRTADFNKNCGNANASELGSGFATNTNDAAMQASWFYDAGEMTNASQLKLKEGFLG